MSTLDVLLQDPAWAPIRAWIAGMTPISQSRAPYRIRRFCQRVGKSPVELLKWQEQCSLAQTLHERREVFRRVQAHIDSIDGTKGYKQRDFVDLCSFFRFHDLPLEVEHSYRVRGTKPQNIGCLRLEDLQAILTAAHVRHDYAMHSMIWTQFQSFSGVGEICHINMHSSGEIVKQIRDGVRPVKIEMLRIRKGNVKPWFTYIGVHAENALREYFDKERGWPKPGDPIWLDKEGGTMTYKSYGYKFLALTRHVKIVPKATKGRGVRYGKSPHELRDLGRSLVHAAHSEQHEIDGKKLLFDAACPEFWMGHEIDPLRYNEFWKHNPENVRRQYLIAAKFLNITSQPAAEQESAKEMETLREEVKQLKGQFELFAKGKLEKET